MLQYLSVGVSFQSSTGSFESWRLIRVRAPFGAIVYMMHSLLAPFSTAFSSSPIVLFRVLPIISRQVRLGP